MAMVSRAFDFFDIGTSSNLKTGLETSGNVSFLTP
jgi:hypothetical protein